MITTLTEASSAMASIAPCSASISATDRALRAAGRFRVRKAMPSSSRRSRSGSALALAHGGLVVLGLA